MRIRQLAPGLAWNEAERRAYPAGFIAFFVAGLMGMFGYVPGIHEPALAGACGSVGAFVAVLAMSLGYYNRRSALLLLTALLMALLPTILTTVLLPWLRHDVLAFLPSMVIGLSFYVLLNRGHLMVSKVAPNEYLRQVVDDAGDDLKFNWSRRVVWALAWLSCVTGLMIIAIVLVFGATITAQLETRRYVWNGQTIVSELRADDRHVEIETSDRSPEVGQRPATVDFEALVTGTDLIAVGDVEAAEPIFLVARAGARYSATAETANWIDSFVTIRLTRVIKDAGFGVSAGSRVQFRQKGGRARIRGVLVDAIVPWQLPLHEGKSYLILGMRHEGQYLHNDAYEVDEALRLRKMASTATNPIWRDRSGAAPEPVSTDDELELMGADALFSYLEGEALRQAEKNSTRPR